MVVLQPALQVDAEIPNQYMCGQHTLNRCCCRHLTSTKHQDPMNSAVTRAMHVLDMMLIRAGAAKSMTSIAYHEPAVLAACV